MIILIGERANGQESARANPLHAELRIRLGAFRWGPSRKRLLDCGLKWDAAANLLPATPTAVSTWNAQDKRDAVVSAANLNKWARDNGYQMAVVGARAVESFGYSFSVPGAGRIVSYLEGEETLILAHPSGLSRWWNTPGNTELATAASTEFTKRHYGGSMELIRYEMLQKKGWIV